MRYVFFSESPKRWEILQVREKFCTNIQIFNKFYINNYNVLNYFLSQRFATEGKITLKNVSRWSSREAATKCLFLNLPEIHAALLKIAKCFEARYYKLNKPLQLYLCLAQYFIENQCYFRIVWN